MKVLKEGNGQKSWSTEQVCTGEGNFSGGCGAILLVEFTDLYKTHRYCRDDHDVFITFKCPCCSVETDLKKSIRVPSVKIIPDQKKEEGDL